MADNISTLSDFLVSVGFDVDKTAAKKAVAEHARVEKQLTKTNEQESAKRLRAEEKEQAKREQARKSTAKKEDERQRNALKQMEAFAVKASSFAAKAFVGMEAAALGVVYAVDKAAKSYERLNYMAQRTGAKPGSIGAFGYASGQLGSSSEEANASLETFGQKLRLNTTGYAQALERLGVKTKDAKGHLRDTAEIATDLGDALRRIQENGGKYGYTNAVTQAGVFGFSEIQARALMSPDFRKREGQYRADQKAIGADPNAAAAGGTAFEQSMRHLEEVLGHVETKVDGVLFQKLKPLLDDLAKWFTEHGAQVADIVGRIADDLVKLAKAIADKLAGADWKAILDNVEELAKKFDDLAKRLTGSDGLTALFAAFGGVLALKVLSPLVGIVTALTRLSAFAMPPWLTAMLGLSIATDAAVPNKEKPALIKKWDDDAAGGGMDEESVSGAWQGIKSGFGWVKRKLGFGGKSADAGGGGSNAAKGQTAANVNTLMAAAQDQLAQEGVPEANRHAAAAALIGNVIQESGGDPTKKHDGGTGYGIYGARDPGLGRGRQRRTEMFNWLAANGYDRDSAEGQARYMAHEAMKYYPRTAAALKSATGTNLGDVTNTVATDFEAPAAWAANYGGRRNNAARVFGQVPPKKLPPMVRQKPLAAAPKLPYVPGQPQGMKGGGYMAAGLGADGKPVRALGDTHISTSTRGDTTITSSPTFHISGGDPVQTLEAARRMASRGHQDLLRNIQGAEQ